MQIRTFSQSVTIERSLASDAARKKWLLDQCIHH
jgi:hypothetical protein